MASHDQYPQEDNVTKEQIPHSFRHGETPHREFDNTPLTDAVEQGLIITPDSPALLMPEKKSKKGAVLVGGAVLATIATVGSIIGLSSGDNEKAAGPTKEPTVSAPVNPIEVAPTVPTIEETGPITMENLSSYMIGDYETPADIANSYSNVLSDIVNERFWSGDFEHHKDDLLYVADPNSPESNLYGEYVSNLVENLKLFEKKAEENGLADDGIMLGVAMHITNEKLTENGITFDATHEYRGLTGTGEYLGLILGNEDDTRFTFEYRDVTLPDGSTKNVLLLTQREDLLNP